MDLALSMAARGLTNATLADLVGVSPEAVRLWKLGKRKIGLRHLRAVEEAAGLPKHVLRPDIYENPCSDKANIFPQVAA